LATMALATCISSFAFIVPSSGLDGGRLAPDRRAR
jgi:hypothetical protein